jgi:glycosyltransferase involved in cell wall biosynthesis
MITSFELADNRAKMYGIKRMTDPIMPRGTRRITIPFNRASRLAHYGLAFKYLIGYSAHRTSHNIFNDQSFAALASFKDMSRNILGVQDCITKEYYDFPESWTHKYQNYKKFGKVLTISEFSKKQLITAGVPKDNIVVVPLGVDKSTFYPLAPRNYFRTLAGLSDKKVLLTCNNLMPHKNPEFMLDVLQYLPEEWVLIRCGYYHGNDYQKVKNVEVKYKVKEYGLESRYIDYTFYSDINHLYNIADVYSSASYMEGFDLPTVESLASGTPVVASDIPAHLEQYDRFGAGYNICSSWKPEEWAEEIRLAYSYQRGRGYTSSLAHKVFSWENGKKVMEELFDEVGRMD